MSENADHEQEENKRFSGKLRHTSGARSQVEIAEINPTVFGQVDSVDPLVEFAHPGCVEDRLIPG